MNFRNEISTSQNTGATEKTKTDYFQITRNTDPVESYGIDEFKKRIEAARKKKAQKHKARTKK